MYITNLCEQFNSLLIIFLGMLEYQVGVSLLFYMRETTRGERGVRERVTNDEPSHSIVIFYFIF